MPLDTPTGVASGLNKEGTVIVGAIGQARPYSVYWVEGSPPTINKIGFLRDGTYSCALAVRDQGSPTIMAVGYGDTTGGVKRAFYWKKNGSPHMINLGVLDNDIESQANAVDLSGRIIVGASRRNVSGGSRATRWDYSGPSHPTMRELKAPEGASDCSAEDINDDGSVIVGKCSKGFTLTPQAVCWLGGTTTEVTELECLGNRSSSTAEAVSNNGNVIVGSSTEPGNPNREHAVCWRRNPSTERFEISNLSEVHPDTPQAQFHACARGVNQDGTVIVGTIESEGALDAFIWRADATPKVHKLEDASEHNRGSYAFDVTTKADGTIIVVGCSPFCDNPPSAGTIAVSWNNLSINNLHFPT